MVLIAERRRQWAGFMLSLAVHLSLLFLGGWSLMQPARFGMELGSGGLEISLVAAPPHAASNAEAAGATAAEEVVSLLERRVEANRPSWIPTTISSAGGAQTDAKPDNLKNPAPPYPEAARRQGEEGMVVLLISIDKTGHPAQVEVQRSSGYALLDESALTTVRRWKFIPARMGGRPIESAANLQVLFRLKENG